MSAAIIAGIKIPDSKLAHHTTEFIRDTESPLLYHHSRRTFLFGMLHGERRGLKADPELLYVATMFHDLGLVEGHRHMDRRFEVDGADAAREFLRSHDVPEEAIRRVWSSIALHTTHGIPEFMEPEIALVAAGVETDIDGRDLKLLDSATVKEILAEHPRIDFKRQAFKAFTEGSRDRPDTAFGTITADVLEHFSPGFRRKDFVEVVMNNEWPD
ncbi:MULTISPECIES: HD domain-containing protein [unclassified Bradyrhizobium]|uniref:HD domain-containing protein n=1 Tax=unclassified Bradyrhizobium TaxID=2631580 RepID=UPI003393C33F